MSIQKNSYTSKKTGKTKIQYYASVWFAEEKRSIIGPMRNTEKLARQDETDIQRSIESGRAKAATKKRKLKIDEIYTEWHKATAPPVYSNNTWRIYERYYMSYVQEVFGCRSVSEVTPLHIQKYVNLMAEKYSPETVNKCLNILVDIFAFSADVLKCITDNPAKGIKRCTVPKKKKVTWSDSQIEYFLSLPEVQESHYYPMLCLSAALGPRPGEVCGLSEKCLSTEPCYMIDFDRGYDNYECETNLKTNGSHRSPPIPAYLYKIIHRRLLWKKELRLQNPDWGQNDFLFVSQNGNPIKPHQYANGFKRLLQAYNKNTENPLPVITLYGFRTSFATNNMRKHPNAALISSIMGNSPKTLIQFYTQSDTEMQAALINEYVDPKKIIS